MKTVIVVLSDPKGGDEALGRLFNALAAAHDFKMRKEQVRLVFQGAGTRWASILGAADHPAHALYEAVEDAVDGVSRGCADFFGARESAEGAGFELIGTNAIPGTSGMASLASYAAEGYSVITF
jgi:hypothetical protein